MNKEFDIINIRFTDALHKCLDEYSFCQDLWPVVYLLRENKKKKCDMYIGETIDISTRLTYHLNDPSKQKLDEAYVVYGDKFNKSATLDIEARIIRYMAGDGVYSLLNANIGLAEHSYYQRDELYREIFKSIWDEFRHMGIAKHTIREIDNSDLFKYSPYKALSRDQTQSLIKILETLLNDNYKRCVIEGISGTGKTVLAVFLFKLLHTPEENFNFTVFGPEDQHIVELVKEFKKKKASLRMALIIPIGPFRDTVKHIFNHVKGLSAEMVVGPADLATSHYDIILVDEAHRLRQRLNLMAKHYGIFDKITDILNLDRKTATELDWVLKRSNKTVLFYDEFQSVRPGDVPKERFDELKNESQTKIEFLHSQFRVRGGLKYVKFIDKLLRCQLPAPTEKITFKKYDFQLFDDLGEMIDLIKLKEMEYGYARTVAGYAWPWPSKKNHNTFDIEIGSLKLKWNSVRKNWINSKNAINEVGCIHTVQGYDLNYTAIIFGKEISYDKLKNEIFIRKNNYYDINGKKGVKNDEQLKEFILNVYKTLMLRGIQGTYLYVCDEALRAYFAQYIPVYSTISLQRNGAKLVSLKGNYVPLYEPQVAAGEFSEQQIVTDSVELISVPEEIKISKDHFACKVVGESMNKVIPNGSICLFRKYNGGSRNGEIVLASHTKIQDVDFGPQFTIKQYFSEKTINDDTWHHSSIILRPLSHDPRYESIILEYDELSEFKIYGIFERIL